MLCMSVFDDQLLEDECISFWWDVWTDDIQNIGLHVNAANDEGWQAHLELL